MNMSFQQKSAWGSLVGLGLVGYRYFPKAFLVAQSSSSPAPLFWIGVACIVALIVIFGVYHAVIAIHSADV